MASKQTTIQEQKTRLKDTARQITKNWSQEKRKREMKQLTAFSFLFAGAVAGRVALQFVPSVEPIIPLAVLAGFVFGSKEGFSLGAGAYVASNFLVWGLQGPWTLFQAMGAGVPGALAGIMSQGKKPNATTLVLFSAGGTVLFEILMNLYGSVAMMSLLGAGLVFIPLYFVSSLPFSLIHIGSNAVFARALAPVLSKLHGGKNHAFEMVSVRRIVDGRRTDIRMYKTK